MNTDESMSTANTEFNTSTTMKANMGNNYDSSACTESSSADTPQQTTATEASSTITLSIPQLPAPKLSETEETDSVSSSTSAAMPPHVPDQPTDDFFFFGRDEELQHLRNTRQRIHDNQPIFPAALVWGTSGTGKSMLIEHFLNQTCCSCGVRSQSNKHSDEHQDPQQAQKRCSCCYMMRGKYDEYTGSKDPFSAIIQALDDFATQLQQGSADELERMRRCVQNAFAADTDVADQDQDNITHNDSVSQTHIGTPAQTHSAMAALIAVVPSLSVLVSDTVGSSSSVMTGRSTPSKRNVQRATSNNDLSNGSVSTNSVLGHAMSEVVDVGVGVDVGGDTSNNAATANPQSAWNRLCYIFIQFMKAISTPQRPVYLFLDDLQWSSAAGLELLASLLTDTGLNGFMLLGAIRQETDPHNHQAMELSPDAPLQTSFLDRLLSQDDVNIDVNIDVNQSTKQLEQITLGDLSVTDCTQWLSHLLHRSRDDDDLKVLVSKIHNKTHGNVYFTLQAIEELKRGGIILHNRTSKRWEWDLSHSTGGGDGDGDGDLPIGDNIVAIIEMQLKDQPHDLQYALSVAAYIRSTFDIHVLQVVLQHVNDHGGLDMMFQRGREGVTAEGGVAQMTIPEASAWTIDRLHSVLEKALLEGLITNSIGESRYHFAHDRVQQAAHGLIPFGEARNKLRLQIGNCLLDIYRKSKTTAAAAATATLIADQEEDQEEGQEGHDDAEGPTGTNRAGRHHHHHHQQQHLIRDVDSLLFIAANHLNSMSTKDHLFLVTFNLEVGQKALQMAALSSAATYLQKASVALQRVRNPWEDHYDLCLELFRCRSEVELSLGNFETGHNIGNAIIKKARTLDEKLPTYFVMAQALGREDKAAESLSVSLSVARNLGVFPRRFYLFHVANDFLWMKALLKNNTDEDILNLPILQDPKMLMAVQFVREIGVRSFLTGDSIQWLVQALKQTRTTMRYGINPESAPVFASLGMIFDICGEDRSLVMRCAGISHKLLQIVGGPEQAGWVHVVTSGAIYVSSEPHSKCIKGLEKGYSLGMESGNFELGLVNLQCSKVLAFYFGCKLQPLVGSLENVLKQYQVYNIKMNDDASVALLMVSQYLTGGQPIDWDDIKGHTQQDLKKRGSDANRLLARYPALLVPTILLRKYELAQQMTKLYYGLPDHSKNYCYDTTVMLAQGLSSSALYLATGKAKHKKELKRQIGLARAFVANKGSNATSLLQLLKAERLSLKAKGSNLATIRRAEEAYGVTILVAQKASLTHYCAIACEQAAEHFIRALGRVARNKPSPDMYALQTSLHDSICKYMAQAVQYYREWGCSVKVKDIQERRSKYLDVGDGHGEAQLQGGDHKNAHQRVVDIDIHNTTGSMADASSSRNGRSEWRAGVDVNDHKTKWMQGSAKGSVSGRGGGMSYMSNDHSGTMHQSHSLEEDHEDDDVSVLTDASG